MTTIYRCKGCGELDTIEEVNLQPRTMSVRPAVRAPGAFDYTGLEHDFYESDITLGFGCSNDVCEFWQGNYGHDEGPDIAGYDPALIYVRKALALDEIAEEVDA